MIDEILSHYRIIERIGEGGMGVVFKAEDLKLARFVALKFLAPRIGADLQFRERFLREARAVSSLDHPNICTIYEIGETDDGQLFIAMAYCVGEPLGTRLKRGPLRISEAVDLCIQSARGLEHAHKHGVIHRDIKPANLMIGTEGLLKIVDFGLAKRVGEPELTNPGIVVGTVGYLAPEQLRGESVDHRADIWALGVTLYQLISGQLPFGVSSERTIAYSILNEAPKPLVEEIPSSLEHVIQTALEKNPGDRYQSARQLLLALRAVTRQFESDEEETSGFAATKNTAIVHPSIAVLPFTNMSSDPENEYFSDGLTEELINCLSQLPGLRVVSRTSVFQFKGKATDIQEIGRQLNVATVLEGGVRRSNNSLRVTAQLFSVADGYQLWSERFDRTMKDVFEIQDEIASNITSKLQLRLAGVAGLPPLVKRHTQNLEAYHLYLKGRFYWSKRTPDGFQKAFEHFEKALAEDPNFALAYAGLADCHIMTASWGLAPANEAWPKAEANALNAVELGPSVAEGHVSLGYVLMIHKWDWASAELEYVQAVTLNPGCALAHMQYSMCLVAQGRLTEALVEIERALEVDPLSLPINAYLAGALYYSREYDRAIQQCRKALEIDPEDVETHIALGLVYEAKQMFGEAIEAYDRARTLSRGSPLIIGVLAGAYAKAGRKEQALELLNQLNEMAKQAFVTPSAMALIYIGLDDRDRAFEYLKTACEAHDTLMSYLGVGPFFDSLRSDSRFAKLLEMVNLVGTTRLLTLSKTKPAQQK